MIRQIDFQNRSRTCPRNHLVVRFAKFDKQQSAIGRILAKDVAIGSTGRRSLGDDCFESSLLNGPYCMLSGRPTSEIGAHNEDRSALGILLIQSESRPPHIVEQQFAIPAPSNHRQKPSRNDAIRIDIVVRENRDDPSMNCEAWHPPILAYSPQSMVVPDKPEFLRRVAGGKRMPIYRDLLADVETPVSAYWKLSHDQTYSFLLESVTGGEQLARYSLLGIRPKIVLRTKNESVTRESANEPSGRRLGHGEDPLHALRSELAGPEVVAVPDLPAFVGGAVGMMSYDLVRFFEKLPDSTVDDLNVDDLAMMLTDTVVVFDHAKNVIRIIAMATEESYDEAVKEIEEIVHKLKSPLPNLPDVENRDHPIHPIESNLPKARFEEIVTRMVEYIAAGDAFQLVPSQRFQTQVDVHPLTLYRALRSLNPSPYMFILRFGDFDIVGASPELLVSLHGRKARVRPIAGTRWRGGTPEEDKALEMELLADEKERAEHIMLVDLGRNDLGRVCEYGSVEVNELMVIERYSHVMHIVSDVTGTLEVGKDAYDLIRASFPAGTVAGAPKVRAMEIIDELESTRRGLYAGAVGFVSHTGDFDACIAIRTIYLKDGKAYVQAGGGVVFDSKPEFEFNESCNKAKGSLRAIEIAQAGL